MSSNEDDTWKRVGTGGYDDGMSVSGYKRQRNMIRKKKRGGEKATYKAQGRKRIMRRRKPKEWEDFMTTVTRKPERLCWTDWRGRHKWHKRRRKCQTISRWISSSVAPIRIKRRNFWIGGSVQTQNKWSHHRIAREDANYLLLNKFVSCHMMKIPYYLLLDRVRVYGSVEKTWVKQSMYSLLLYQFGWRVAVRNSDAGVLSLMSSRAATPNRLNGSKEIRLEPCSEQYQRIPKGRYTESNDVITNIAGLNR
jgi:hypothetical protein